MTADVGDVLGLTTSEPLRPLEDGDLERTLRRLVHDATENNPRSLQKRIGMSEAAHPCARRLAFRMSEVEKVNTRHDPWPSFVGTSVHAQLAAAALADNERLGRTRWLVEHPVTIYDDLAGTLDLYDNDTETVIDHKALGATTHRSLVNNGPSSSYRQQVTGYGLGLTREGYSVKRVAIAAWPRSGMLRGLHVWSAPFDESELETTLARYDTTRAVVAARVPISLVPATPGECHFCPWYTPGATTDPNATCSGDTNTSGNETN